MKTHFAVLDIETSKFIPKNSSIPSAVWLSYGYCNLYDIYGKEQSNNYFRTWEELENLFEYYEAKFNSLIVYVHNLSYEADFMFKNISKPSKLLCNKSHKIITTVLEKYEQITFKCSYCLSQKSLRKLGEELGFPKGDNDYSMKLPKDEISEDDKKYCLRDCDIVAKYIRNELIEYKSLDNIPLTNTGRVRKDLNKFYIAEYGKKGSEWDLLPKEDCFKALCDAYWGAITISNPEYTNKILNGVRSFDETSEYPYELLNSEYPYDINKLYNLDNLNINKYKFWIAKIKFKRIKKRYEWCWLSRYKMQEYSTNCEFFNGKLQYGSEIVITMTNIDFENVNKTYIFDSYEIIEFYYSDKYGKIPKPIKELIIKYAKDKTLLKEKLSSIEETDDNFIQLNLEYLRIKGKLNAIYGMFCQKLIQSDYEIDDNYIWHEIIKEYKYTENTHLKRNFLFGIYDTAYSRRDWINFVITNCPYTFVYGDTDSVKFIDKNDEINVISTNKLLDIDNEYVKNFGIFEEEKKYDRFITWGAKKYAYEHENNCSCTIAGLPKRKPNYYHSKLEEFKLGETFYNCKKANVYLTNNLEIYMEEETDIIEKIKEIDIETKNFLNDNNINDKGGCAIYDTFYTLNITENDLEVLKDYE